MCVFRGGWGLFCVVGIYVTSRTAGQGGFSPRRARFQLLGGAYVGSAAWQ